MVEGLQFAYLARASGCGNNLEAWHCGPCAKVPGMRQVRTVSNFALSTHAFVGLLNGQCVLTFRGSDYINAWIQDVRGAILVDWPACTFNGETCQVGSGYLEDYNALTVEIRAALDDIGCTRSARLLIAGHSLGGALATLALFDLKQRGYNVMRAYTFGQPRVGDRAFAGAFASVLRDVPLYRVTNFADPVPLVPLWPAFQHVGQEVYFWGPGASNFRLCAGDENPSCARSNLEQLPLATLQCIGQPQTCGHLTYFPPMHPFLVTCSSPQGLLFP